MTEEEFLKRKEAADTHDEEAAEVNIDFFSRQITKGSCRFGHFNKLFFRAEITLLNRHYSRFEVFLSKIGMLIKTV